MVFPVQSQTLTLSRLRPNFFVRSIAKADLLSVVPVADEYLQRLRADLKEAELVRFSVCYVSSRGLELIGLESFEKAFFNDSAQKKLKDDTEKIGDSLYIVSEVLSGQE